MKSKRYNKILIIAVIFSSCLGFLNLTPVVLAETNDYEDCEDISVPIGGYLDGLNSVTTWSNKDGAGRLFAVRSDYGYYVGGRSLKQPASGVTSLGYINFSDPIIHLDFYATSSGISNAAGDDYWSVFLLDSSGAVAGSFVLYCPGNTVGLLVKDPTHGAPGYNYMYWGQSGTSWNNYNRIHFDVEGEYMNVSVAHDSSLNAWKLIDCGERINDIVSIKFQNNPNYIYPSSYYYDNFTVTMGVTPEEIPEGGCGEDLSSYQVIGNWPVGLIDVYYYGNNVFTLEQKYNMPIDINIRAVGLLCDRTQSDQLKTAGCYYVRLNGGTNYATTCDVIDYSADWDLILFYFPTLVNVNADSLLIEITSQCAINGGAYGTRWCAAYHSYVGPYGPQLPDGDDDGIHESKYSTYAANGLYDGTSISQDLVYFVYYSEIIIEEEESQFPNCFISTDKSDYIVGENVNMYFEINQSAYPTSVAIYKQGSGQVFGGWPYVFPYTIPGGHYQGTISYSFFSDGVYDIKLRRQSKNVTGCKVTVAENNEDFYVSTRPNPSVDFFKIFYRYYHDLGEPGLLLIGTRPDMHNVGDALMSWEITSNTSSNETWVYTSDTVVKLYVVLYAKSGSTYQPVTSTIHWVIPQYDVYDLQVVYNYYLLTSENAFFDQWYTGYHTYYNYDVRVKLNNLTIRNVGQELSFNFKDRITEGRWYNATLVLSTNNGSRVLTYKTFQVVPYTPQTSGQDQWSFLGGYKYVFAVGILLMFVLIPMFLASRLAIDIPALAYIASGSIGVVFCVTAGLLATYWVFFIVVTLVATAVIMFVR